MISISNTWQQRWRTRYLAAFDQVCCSAARWISQFQFQKRTTLRSGIEIIYCNYRICGSYFLINLFASFSDVAFHQNNHEKAPVSFKVVPRENNPSVKEAKYRSNRRKCGNYNRLFGCQIEAYITTELWDLFCDRAIKMKGVRGRRDFHLYQWRKQIEN